ncbi:MAG: uracil-DNA glycosylase, partial [Verrucomicrobiota bacterium]
MKEQLIAIVDALKRLRKSGVSHVSVSDSSIQALAKYARSSTELFAEVKAEVRSSIPDHIRTASAEDFKKVMEHAPQAAREAAKRKEGRKFPPAPIVELPEGDKQTRWDWLREKVLSCPTCNAHKRDGYKVVFGAGNLDADIFFCGEAPGADEEEQGEPFVGKAGQLLTRMIAAMGTKREEVYISNIMNWRPEMPTRVNNRPPTEEEMGFCLPYLKAQLDVVQPKVIVALG